jgi:hypothetical protein
MRDECLDPDCWRILCRIFHYQHQEDCNGSSCHDVCMYIGDDPMRAHLLPAHIPTASCMSIIYLTSHHTADHLQFRRKGCNHNVRRSESRCPPHTSKYNPSHSIVGDHELPTLFNALYHHTLGLTCITLKPQRQIRHNTASPARH